jgi:MerR family transcriptional regulator, light-induced transcriptional regulator
MTPRNEPRHPIGVVAERTGLTPDVLRVWERRYSVVDPSRSTGGQRVYSDADIERLSLLRRATQGGHGISHVASLSKSRLEELVREIEEARHKPTRQSADSIESQGTISKAIELAEALDPNGLELLLKRNVARYGLVAFIDSIAAPFLRTIGDRWHSGMLTVSQEHFATAVVQRVVTETAPLLTAADGGPAIVIGTLEGERHANGALMAAATAASEGWRVIYLGADLPAGEIADTAMRARARAIGISVVLAERKTRAKADLRHLAESVVPGTTILVGGTGSKELRGSLPGSETVFVESMDELRAELAAMKTNA